MYVHVYLHCLHFILKSAPTVHHIPIVVYNVLIMFILDRDLEAIPELNHIQVEVDLIHLLDRDHTQSLNP